MSDGLPFFAVRLNELLAEKGLTQYALAKRSGVSKQTLSRLAAGSPGPTWDTVQRLALALGVDCKAFHDPAIVLPESEPVGKRVRPRKKEAGGPPKTPRGRPRKVPGPKVARRGRQE